MSAFRHPWLLVAISVLFLAGCATPERRREAEVGAVQQAASHLKRARKTSSSTQVRAGYYLDAASIAAAEIMKEKGAASRESPSQAIYNAASAELAALLRDNGPLWRNPDKVIQSPTGQGIYRVHLEADHKGELWQPHFFTAFKPASKVKSEGFHKRYVNPGYGGSLVGIRRPQDEGGKPLPFSEPAGETAPVTATLDFPTRLKRGRTISKNGHREVILRLNNPTKRERVTLIGDTRPLAADFTAPLAYFPRRSELWAGVTAMLEVEKYLGRTGLYMLQPPDPERIPVVFVHGLASTPQMWMNVINELEGDPLLRSKYQFWVYWYPTGLPITYSALRLRENLARANQLYPMQKGYVLVGHSMGGIVSRMQVTNSERHLWDAVLGKNADRVYQQAPADSVVRQALIFEADPNAKRVIYICTPHGGCELAIDSIGKVATSLIKIPVTVAKGFQSALGGSYDVLTGNKGRRMPTGIQSLSPKSPSLLALHQQTAVVPQHSVIGDRGRGDSPNSSDGVVHYSSSHIQNVESELIVPGPHGSYKLPQTIEELRRILRLHLTAQPLN